MMMPENIELRIKHMAAISDCIEEAKVCLTICQPSSLVSEMTTLTVAPKTYKITHTHLLPCAGFREITCLQTDRPDRVDKDKEYQF